MGFDAWVGRSPGGGTHSGILAWRIPWTEESGGLQSVGSQSQTRPSGHKGRLSAPEDRGALCHAQHCVSRRAQRGGGDRGMAFRDLTRFRVTLDGAALGSQSCRQEQGAGNGETWLLCSPGIGGPGSLHP